MSSVPNILHLLDLQGEKQQPTLHLASVMDAICKMNHQRMLITGIPLRGVAHLSQRDHDTLTQEMGMQARYYVGSPYFRETGDILPDWIYRPTETRIRLHLSGGGELEVRPNRWQRENLISLNNGLFSLISFAPYTLSEVTADVTYTHPTNIR